MNVLIYRQGVLNHSELHCLFSNLSNLASNKKIKIRIAGPLWGESTGDWKSALAKVQ